MIAEKKPVEPLGPWVFLFAVLGASILVFRDPTMPPAMWFAAIVALGASFVLGVIAWVDRDLFRRVEPPSPAARFDAARAALKAKRE